MASAIKHENIFSSSDIGTAVALHQDIEAISKQPADRSIGHCPDVVKNFTDEQEVPRRFLQDGARIKTSKIPGVKQLRGFFSDFPPPFAAGVLRDDFRLKITLPGAEFDGKITPGGDWRAAVENVKKWYSVAAISGYGDVRTLETKVDESVRAAREITADHIQLEDSLLRLVEQTWLENHFVPGQVRAQFYKMHLYGPKGHFRSHKDTPEQDLVGTFLLGLGEDLCEGHFKIGKTLFSADQGHWVAFHPDVPHSVTPLCHETQKQPKAKRTEYDDDSDDDSDEDNDEEDSEEEPSGQDEYRATLAFKLFRAANSGPDLGIATSHSFPILKALETIPTPYGLILSHEYCLGTEKFGAFDAALLDSIKVSTKVDYRVVPIITKFYAEYYDSQNVVEEFYSSCNVFPITKADIDLFHHRNIDEARKATEWYRDLRNIPFYLIDTIEKSGIIWQKATEGRAEFTGNESRPETEDSLYLSYALIVQDKPTN